MSWSKCVYLYHKERQGKFLGDAQEAELILDYKGTPLTVNQYLPEGRYGMSRIQACIPVFRDQPFELTISPRKKSGGIFALLEEGYFDHELGRRVTSNNEALARKVMADEALRAALLACPDKNIEVRPGPEGTHMLRVYVINPEGLRSTWPVCAIDNDYDPGHEIHNADEIRQLFFPPFERLLSVTYAVREAVCNAKI